MGTQFVSSGVTSSGLVVSGAGNTLEVLSGGFASATVVAGGGNLQIDSGGSAAGAFISSGGSLFVFGTITNNVDVYSGGVENIVAGGFTSGALNSGTRISRGKVNVFSGGSA